MAHLEYNDNNITHAPGRAPSLTGSSQNGNRMPITSCSSALPGSMWRLGHCERGRLSRLSKFLVVGGKGMLVNSLALVSLFQGAHLPLGFSWALVNKLPTVNNFC